MSKSYKMNFEKRSIVSDQRNEFWKGKVQFEAKEYGLGEKIPMWKKIIFFMFFMFVTTSTIYCHIIWSSHFHCTMKAERFSFIWDLIAFPYRGYAYFQFTWDLPMILIWSMYRSGCLPCWSRLYFVRDNEKKTRLHKVNTKFSAFQLIPKPIYSFSHNETPIYHYTAALWYQWVNHTFGRWPEKHAKLPREEDE